MIYKTGDVVLLKDKALNMTVPMSSGHTALSFIVAALHPWRAGYLLQGEIYEKD